MTHFATNPQEVRRGPISTRDLVYPNRFDVLARRRFLEFYDARRDLYRRDFGRFIREARETDYGHFCLKIRFRRKHNLIPALKGPLDRRLFRIRVEGFTRLLESVRARGFDPACPLLMYVPAGPVETTERRRFYRRAVLHNGCHRLAVLMHLGYEEIPPDFWAVKPTERTQVADLTATFLRQGRLDARGHFEFLREYYGRPEHRDFEHLFAEQFGGELARQPAEPDRVNTRLLELVRTLEVDWAAMGAAWPGWFEPFQRWADRAEPTLLAGAGR